MVGNENETKVIKVNAAHWRSDIFVGCLDYHNLIYAGFQTVSMGFQTPEVWVSEPWGVPGNRDALALRRRPGWVAVCDWMPLFLLCRFCHGFSMLFDLLWNLSVLPDPTQDPYPSCQHICEHGTHKQRQTMRLRCEFVWCIPQDGAKWKRKAWLARVVRRRTSSPVGIIIHAITLITRGTTSTIWGWGSSRAWWVYIILSSLPYEHVGVMP